MGVIQNSLNTMLATVMGGVLGAKHLANQAKQTAFAEQNELAGLLKDVPKEKNVEIPEAQENAALYQKAVDLNKEDVMSDAMQGRISPKKVKNLVAAKKALEVAQGELESKQLQAKLHEQRKKELQEKYGGKD